MFAEPNPTVIKAVLHAQGRIPTAAVRPPLLPACSDVVKRALRHVEMCDFSESVGQRATSGKSS
jgi:4-hydroxy-tetrahydrodipicolinate synthase